MAIAELGCGAYKGRHDLQLETCLLMSCIGAGNAVFPLLNENRNPSLRLYAFDYAAHAVNLVQVSHTRVGSPCVQLSVYALVKSIVYLSADRNDPINSLGSFCRLFTSRG